MRKIVSLLGSFALLFSGCRTTDTTPANAYSRPRASIADEREQKVYAFEHRLTPRWAHDAEAALYADLRDGRLDQYRAAAREVVDETFAEALSVRPLEDLAAVVITFEPPRTLPRCHFAAIVRVAEGFRYFTLERSMTLGPDSPKAAFCEWTKEGAHRLLTFTNEVSAVEFERLIRAELTTPAKARADFLPGK
jgi:hypothetical protein